MVGFLIFLCTAKRKIHCKSRLRCRGRHNVLNALAAIAIATDEGVADENIVQGSKGFEGVGRRFEIHGRFKKNEGDFYAGG